MQGIVLLVRDAQVKQTNDALLMLEKLPVTPETIELKRRILVADEKIFKQLRFVEKLDRLVRKYT